MLALSLLFLTAIVAGSPIKSVQDYVKALETRQDVSTQDLDNFIFYAQHAAAAYCNSETPAGSTVTCDSFCPALEGDGVTVIQSFIGDATGIGAYVGVDHARGEVVVAVRGSNNVRNFITDVVFAFQDSDLADGAKVHTGFAAAWDEISEGVTSAVSSALSENAGYRLLISGHSLGGAVATLAGAYLRRSGYPNDIYTFGSPRVGNDVFTDFVTDQTGAEYRVTHLDDPIPRLPPIIFDYRHTSPEYWLSTGGSETVEFAIGDILVCVGDANTDCNAGTDIGLDVEAHLHYFQEISGCGNAFQWKRQTTESDEEVAARLSEWARQDMDYVQNSST